MSRIKIRKLQPKTITCKPNSSINETNQLKLHELSRSLLETKDSNKQKAQSVLAWIDHQLDQHIAFSSC